VAGTEPLGDIVVLPHIFKITQKIELAKHVYKLRCEPVNDITGETIFGTIDFKDEVHPKIVFAWENGNNYLRNITQEGKRLKEKYIPDISLGQE
jgi:hypothetical protein